MKKKLLLVLFAFLGGQIFAEKVKINDDELQVKVVSSNEFETTLEISFGQFEMLPVDISGETYYKPILEKHSNLFEKGAPDLPFISRSIIIPDSKKAAISVIDMEFADFQMAIIPSKGIIYRDQDPAAVPFEFGAEYQIDQFYPAQHVEIGEPYILRDFRGINVKAMPFSYNPVKGVLRIYHRMTIKVTFEGKDNINVKQRKSDKINKHFEAIYKNHFLNFDLGKYPTVGEAGRMIVICYDSYSDEAAPFVEWKLQKGLQTDLYEVSTIGTSKEDIMDFIQDQYDLNNGLTFVQFVGDAPQIPTYSYGGGGSDPTYSLVDGGDDYPDIIIGRFSAQSGAEVQTQVDRSIHYERDLSWGGWLGDGTGIASEQGSGVGWQGYADWEHMDYLRTMLLGFNYDNIDQFYDTGTPTVADVTNALEAGRGIVNYCGHGSTGGWVTTGFNSNDVNALENDYKLPFIHSVGCVNGNFTNATCFAEAWLRAKNNSDGDPTGGIAMYASSINQSWTPPMVAQDYSTQHLVDEDYFTIGALWFNGSCAMIDIKGQAGVDMFMTWHIFGDASLSYRTDTPSYMGVTHYDGISSGQTTFFVNTDESGALVCLSCTDEIIASGYANSLGDITLNLPGTIPCALPTLTVTAYNQITYTSTVYTSADGYWTGGVSDNWHDGGNWMSGTTPGIDDDVTITAGSSHYPVLHAPSGSCKNLLVEAGASLTIHNTTLNVDQDAIIHGELGMSSNYSQLHIDGSITWKSGSTADITAGSANIVVQQGWSFEANSSAQLDKGFVTFQGNLNKAIKCFSSESYFNHLVIGKDPNKYIYFSSTSTHDLVINGNLFINTGAIFRHYADRKMKVAGMFDCDGTHYFSSGTFVFNGDDADFSSNTNSFFNNLEINSTGHVNFYTDVEVRGNLLINDGSLHLNSNTLTIEGNWNNTVGVTGFDELNGTVEFNGDTFQYIQSDENFNILELNNNGSSLVINNSSVDVQCNQYIWTKGILEVQSGDFIALDLYDNGIFGGYMLSGGTIELRNYGGYVDLNGDVYIDGGSFTVYGGTVDSYWPWAASASLHMTGGTLDFKDVGIKVHDHATHTFFDNITGGTIRTYGDFTGDRTDFKPGGGTILLYGPDNVNISHGPGSSFHDITIEKSTLKAGDNISRSNVSLNQKNSGTLTDERRRDKIQSTDSRSYLVTVTSDLDLDGDLRIEEGEFDLNGYSVNVTDDLTIFATLTMTSANDEIIVGDAVNWETGSIANITNGEIFFGGGWYFENGCEALIGTGNTVYLTGTNNQNINSFDNNSGFGDLVLEQSATTKATSSVGSQPVRVSGDLTVEYGNILKLDNDDFIISGDISINSAAELEVRNSGSLEVDTDANVYGDIHIFNGTITIHNNGNFYSTSTIIIDEGNFILDKEYTGAFMFTDGTLEMNGGVFEVTNNGFQLGTSSNVVPNGGILRVGNTFRALHANTFQPAAGILEMIGEGVSSISIEPTNYIHNLIINKEATATANITQATTVNNDLTVQSGIFNTLAEELTVIGNVIIESDGELDPDNGNIIVKGDWTNNRGTAGFTEGTGLVTFTGNDGSYLLTEETFYDLEIYKTGGQYTYLFVEENITCNVDNDVLITGNSFRLYGNATLNVGHDLIISENTMLFCSGDTPTTINITGNWFNYNTTGFPWDYGFLEGISTVTFGGDDDTFIEVDHGSQDFYNLIIDKPGGWFMPLADLTILNDATIEEGLWTKDMSGLTYTFLGDLRIEADGSFDDNTCTVEFMGEDDQLFYNSSSTPSTFDNLIIDMLEPEGENNLVLSILGDIICASDITVNNGTFFVNSQNVECGQNFTINEGGKVSAPNFSVIAMGPGGNLTLDGGELEMFGSSPAYPTITHTSGYYQFNIFNGGTIYALHALFEYMDVNGLYVYSTGNVYDVSPFSECIFQNGETSGVLLKINNEQNLTIDGANFPIITPGASDNVAKIAVNGSLYFTNVSGDFAGPGYEYDPYNRIDWEGFDAGTWTGLVNHSWNNPGNWIFNIKPVDGDNVYIPAGTPNEPWVASANQECESLIIEAGASLRIYDEILTVNGDVQIYGQLRMDNTDGVLNAGDSFGDIISWEDGSSDGITNGTINVFGNWNFKNGTNAQLGTGNTVYFYGTNNSTLYCDDNNAEFGNLVINKTSSTKNNVYLPEGHRIRVAEDLNINDGALKMTSNTELFVYNELLVHNGGHLITVGSSGNEVLVSGYPSYCLFEIDNGGMISAEWATFEYFDFAGVTIGQGGILDPDYAFKNCTFRESPAGGILLTILNDQLITLNKVKFPANTWSGNYNVSKTENQGKLTFEDFTGDFGGPAYEKDPYNRIYWQGMELSVNPANQSVPATAGTTNFNISSNTSWTVSEGESWLSVNPVSGSGNGTLTVSYNENTSVDSRIGEIMVSAAGLPDIIVTVTQAGADPILTVNPPNQDVTAEAGITNFNLTSNLSWDVFESVDWLQVSPSSGTTNKTLIVEYSENTSVESRVGEITVKAIGAPNVVVTVTQAGANPVLIVNPSNQNVGADGGTTSFNLQSNTSWVVTEDEDWLAVDPMSGANNKTLNVEYSKNTSTLSRLGKIVIYAEGAPEVMVTVTQDGAEPELIVYPPNRNVGPGSGNTTFSISSNTTWTIDLSESWLTADPGNGSGDDILAVGYEENLSLDSRIGSIKVSAPGGNPTIIVTVTQDPYDHHNIILPEGWSGFSSYILPADQDIENIFSPISSELVIALTMDGIYYPFQNINTIVMWEEKSAYKIKVNETAELTIQGHPEASTKFDLDDAWNLVPVLIECPVDVTELFEPVISDFKIAKDVAGTGVYWPGMGINSLIKFLPGKAYYVLMTGNETINFGECKKSTDVSSVIDLRPNPEWNKVEQTPGSHIIVFTDEAIHNFDHGDYIGSFTQQGFCTGQVMIDDSQQQLALVVFGKDPFATTNQGFDDGEKIRFRYYKTPTKEEFELIPEFDLSLPDAGGVFIENGLSAIKGFKVGSTGANSWSMDHISVFPNPSNGMFNISGLSGSARIEILDMHGQRVYELDVLFDGQYSLDISDQTDGIYMMVLKQNNFTTYHKLILR